MFWRAIKIESVPNQPNSYWAVLTVGVKNVLGGSVLDHHTSLEAWDGVELPDLVGVALLGAFQMSVVAKS